MGGDPNHFEFDDYRYGPASGQISLRRLRLISTSLHYNPSSLLLWSYIFSIVGIRLYLEVRYSVKHVLFGVPK